MKLTDAITKRILDLCDKNNVTPNKASKNAGLDPSTITSIFYGKSKNPGTVTLKIFCDGLGITIFDFFNCDIFKNHFDE